MWAITRKLMARSSRMLIPAGIAILIGTAFIACTLLFGNTMNDSLRTQMTAQFGDADYVATVDWSKDATVGSLNMDELSGVDGVTGVRADVTESVRLVSDEGGVSGVMVSTATQSSLLPVTIISGSQPTGDGQIAVPDSVARQLKLKVGSSVSVDLAYTGSGSSSKSVKVTGITKDNAGAFTYYGGASGASDDVIAAVGGFAGVDEVPSSAVYLTVDSSKADSAIASVKKILPSGTTITTRQAAADKAVDSLSSSGVNVTTMFLMCFGILAMVVAALVIANTFQVLVAQRRRTLALLRTIGATTGQLYRSVLVEAFTLGLIASALGIGAGIGIMAIVCGTGALSSMGLTARFVLSPSAIIVPILFGVIMTVLASIGSARSATAVTPLEALRPIELTETRKSGRGRKVVGLLSLLLGLALAVWGFWSVWRSVNGGSELDQNMYSVVLLSAIAGCAFTFLGLAVLAISWMPQAMRLGGWIASAFGPSGKIAAANIRRNPRRVAATGTALLIGVTLVSCIATGAQSSKATMAERLDSGYSVDVVAEGGSISDAARSKVDAVDGVKTSVLAPTAVATIPSMKQAGTDADFQVLLVGVKDSGTLSSVIHSNLKGATISDGMSLVPQYSGWTGKELSFPKIMSVNPEGSSTSIKLATQRVDYRQVSSNYPAVVFVDSALFDNGSLTKSGNLLMVRLNASQDALSTTLEGIQKALGSQSGVSVTGPVAERHQWETTINSMMAILVGLLAVAVLIALIGVANTLSLSVIERTRESATLRAIGMTRGQLRRSLAVEALVISLVSGVAGVLLGMVFGWLGTYMVFATISTPVMSVDWTMTITVLLVAALAAVLASVIPARRAVSTPPVRALAEA